MIRKFLSSHEKPITEMLESRSFWVGLFSFCIILFTALGVWGYRDAYRGKTENIIEQKKAISFFVAGLIHDKLDFLIGLGVSFASRPRLVDGVMKDDWAEAISILEGVRENFQFIDHLVLLDPDGTIKADMPSAVPSVIGKSRAGTDWYRAVSKDWKPYVSGIYQRAAEPKCNVVSINIPVRSRDPLPTESNAGIKAEKKVIGILQIQVNLDIFAQWVKEAMIGQGSLVYIVDQNGRIVFHPKFHVLTDIVDFSTVPTVQKLLKGESGGGVNYNPVENEKRVSAYNAISGYGWGVVVTQPTSIAFSKRDKELRGLFFCYFACGFLFLAVLGFIFNDLMTRRRTAESLKALNEELKNQAFLLKRSNKELEQFAYVASHDLQEPLRMVSSFTQLLERKYRDQLDAKAQEYIAFAVDGAGRMQILIDDLLAFSRSGQKDVPLEQVDLNKVLQQILLDMKTLIEESQSVVQYDALPVLQINQTQMTQLFQNLITNAIKYRSQRPPFVRVTSQRTAEHEWQFAVADNGIGIEEKYFSKLFVIFQRLHSRSAYKGTGIGLALCKKIVENYAGRIWVESKPGEGTTFKFTLKEGGT